MQQHACGEQLQSAPFLCLLQAIATHQKFLQDNVRPQLESWMLKLDRLQHMRLATASQKTTRCWNWGSHQVGKDGLEAVPSKCCQSQTPFPKNSIAPRFWGLTNSRLCRLMSWQKSSSKTSISIVFSLSITFNKLNLATHNSRQAACKKTSAFNGAALLCCCLSCHLAAPTIAFVTPCWSSAATTVATFSLGRNVTSITRRVVSASDLQPGTCTIRQHPELGKIAITDGLIAMDAWGNKT